MGAGAEPPVDPAGTAAEELSVLAGAVRAHLARERRRGRRRLPEVRLEPARRPEAGAARAGGSAPGGRSAGPERPAPARHAAAPSSERPAPAGSLAGGRGGEPSAPRPDTSSSPSPAASSPAAAAPSGGELFPRPGRPRRPAAAAAPSPAPSGAAWQEELERRVAAVREEAAAAPDLEALRACVADCTRCRLARTRRQTVFADGAPDARVMFVGEGPGREEDEQGVPFVGPAGQLLTRIIEAGMGLRRSDVYIANVVKCRPPQNRDPTAQEKRICTGWLDRQIELVDPEVIVPLGRHAAGHVLSSDASMGRMRARVHLLGGRKVVPTYHPAYLLRSPDKKPDCWADIRLAMAELGLAPPGRG